MIPADWSDHVVTTVQAEQALRYIRKLVPMMTDAELVRAREFVAGRTAMLSVGSRLYLRSELPKLVKAAEKLR